MPADSTTIVAPRVSQGLHPKLMQFLLGSLQAADGIRQAYYRITHFSHTTFERIMRSKTGQFVQHHWEKNISPAIDGLATAMTIWSALAAITAFSAVLGLAIGGIWPIILPLIGGAATFLFSRRAKQHQAATTEKFERSDAILRTQLNTQAELIASLQARLQTLERLHPELPLQTNLVAITPARIQSSKPDSPLLVPLPTNAIRTQSPK